MSTVRSLVISLAVFVCLSPPLAGAQTVVATIRECSYSLERSTAMKRYIFPEPLDATCKLQPDSMTTPILGVSDTHPSNGAACQSFDVPVNVPNKNGATLTITRTGYVPIALHGILETLTSGGGGFECDVFKLQKPAAYEVTFPQPLVFDSNGGSGSFSVRAAAGLKWDADEGTTAEDWVVVAKGVVDGNGTKTFHVLSAAQQPNVPLPRQGYLNVMEQSSGTGAVLARVQVLQK